LGALLKTITVRRITAVLNKVLVLLQQDSPSPQTVSLLEMNEDNPVEANMVQEDDVMGLEALG